MICSVPHFPLSSIWRHWVLIAVAAWMSIAPKIVVTGVNQNDHGSSSASKTDRVPPVCVYLYANADPVGNIDPSGYFSIGFGNDAHTAIQEAYEDDFEHFGHNMLTGTTKGVFADLITKVIKPDIVNFTQKTFAEIKPFSIYGITTGALQIAKYSTYLYPFGFTRDSWPRVPQTIIVQGKIVSYFNAGGIIFYTDPAQNVLETAALVALAVAKNIPLTLRTVQSTLAFIRVAAPAYAATARSANVAQLQALPAQIALSFLLFRF